MDAETKEILLITGEECSEVSQAVSKVMRFGWDSTHPDKPQYTNQMHLEEELGDVLAMIDILVERCLISDENLNVAKHKKIEKLKRWSNITFK